VLASPHDEVVLFVRRLADRGQLAGAVFEVRGLTHQLRLWRRRIRRNGWASTMSQLAALLIDRTVDRAANRTFGPRRGQVVLPDHIRAANINDLRVQSYLRSLQPSLVVVVGTNLLREPLLDGLSQSCVINLHAGRTPMYRGTHGGAWALIRGRPGDVVSTWHLLEAGIDTGMPLVYVPVAPARTLSQLARNHRSAGLLWLEEQARIGVVDCTPPTSAPKGPLLYPPGLRAWLIMRRHAAQAMTSFRPPGI
jgi:folate-dependent phosphoribosylglycinamide formyltransferase PurN